MTVIAMTRELGSFGKDVAAGVAAELGLEIVQHELIEHRLAAKLNTSESLVHRFCEGEASLLDRWRIDALSFQRHTAEEVMTIARGRKVLIRGWGAVPLLAPVAHVLRVRICAPMPLRITRMRDWLGRPHASLARRMIDRTDAIHADTLLRKFAVDWQSPELYHVVLNTGCLSVSACIDQIKTLASSRALEETEASRQVLDDLLVTVRVRIALERAFGASHKLSVTVDKGDVVLTGMMADRSLIALAAGVIRGIPGVAHVVADAPWSARRTA